MKELHHVYLIPGLLGFAEIGGITYFHHVRELLEDWFEAADAFVVAHAVSTSPTASIRRRAPCVFEEIQRGDNDPLGKLTPGGIDLVNAATEDQPGVRYGSVVKRSGKPGWSTMRAIKIDPYRQASHVLYRFVYGIDGDRFSRYSAEGDHLDVCGHFHDPEHDSPHYDWLATGTGFDRPRFESLWRFVTDFILRPPS